MTLKEAEAGIRIRLNRSEQFSQEASPQSLVEYKYRIILGNGGMILTTEKDLRVCEKGHQYYKSSDCKSCPICHEENKPKSGFLAKLSSPARNALLHEGIDTLKKLSLHTEKEILNLHGIGPASIPMLRASLAEEGLTFKK